MKRKKRFLNFMVLALSAVVSACLFAGCDWKFWEDWDLFGEKDPTVEAPPDADVSLPDGEIKYLMVTDKGVEAIPDFLFKKNGSYQTHYVGGTEIIVDDLRDVEYGNEVYTFAGWYLDEECTLPFEGSFSWVSAVRVLYADVDVSVSTWTGFY